MRKTLNHPKESKEYFAIPSKSIAHRALILSSFANEPTEIVCPIYGDDVKATMKALITLGADIKETKDGFLVNPIKQLKEGTIDCKDSASTYRFFYEITKALDLNCKLIGSKRLIERIESGANTSQYLSGKIMAKVINYSLERPQKETMDSLTNEFSLVSSKEYVNVTRGVLRDFGYIYPGDKLRSPKKYVVEGDWSLGSVWLCVGALSEEGVTVNNLNSLSFQGDSQIVQILRGFGARVSVLGNSITVRKSFAKLEGQKIDGSSTLDLVPLIAVLSTFAIGVTEIRNVENLKFKESNRIETTVNMIRALGGDCEANDNTILIAGHGSLRGGIVDSMGDHRIAMAASFASFGTKEKVEIENPDAVSKSYPNFFELIKSTKR